MIGDLAVVRAVRDAVIVADAVTGVIVDANPAAVALCGSSLAELRSLHYTQLHAPVEIPFAEFTLPDGRRMLIGVFRNGSDRQVRTVADENFLRQSEFVQAALDNISDAVVACDSNGDLSLFNRAAREWHGVDALKLPADQWASYYDLFGADGTTPLDVESIPLRRAFCGEHFHDAEMTIAAKGQPLRHILASGRPFYDNDGQKLGAVVAMHDVTERKHAEQSLRESEERFRQVADTAPVMIWVSGPDNLGTFFNKAWLDFTGRTMEQELGDGWANGVHRDDLDHCLATCGASFDARRAFHIEFRLRRADGEYRWVHDTGVPRYRDREFIGFIGSCLDISEQKLSQEQLRASEALLMDAQRLAKVGSWERQLETNKIRWSDEIFRIFGLTDQPPSDLAALLSYVHPRDREKLLEANRQVLCGNAPVEIEYRIIRPDGEVRFVRGVRESILNERGVPVRIVGATQDITELVKARESLRESEYRLMHAERIAHVGHWHRDIETNLASWSEETFSIFGKSRDYTPTYEGFLQAVVPQDRERVDRAVTNATMEKRGDSIEYQIARPNGEIRTVSDTFEVLLDDEGLPAQVFGASQDITDIKRAQKKDVERQKLETVGTLAGGIAHDFNNLLGGVLSQAELALAEIAGGSYPVEQLKVIQGVATRGSEIVRELMIFAGQESAVAGPVDVSQIVEEMLGLLKVSVSKHAKLEADLGRNLPAVWGNAAQLGQIVMNLVTNASQAIGARDGLIRVTTKRTTVGAGDYVQLEVSDTGEGMSVETQAKVFDPFFTTKSGGHGLGLAVVQGIVRGLRGEKSTLRASPGKVLHSRYRCHVSRPHLWRRATRRLIRRSCLLLRGRPPSWL